MNIKLKYPLRRTDESEAVVCLKIGEQSFFRTRARIVKTRSKIYAGARRQTRACGTPEDASRGYFAAYCK